MLFLVAYDGSEFARRALERTAALLCADDKVAVVAVIASDSLASDMVNQQRLLKEAAAVLDEQDSPCETIEASGRPAEAIRQIATDIQADIIVVGSRGRGAAASILLGSVSGELVREAPCDVLVVR